MDREADKSGGRESRHVGCLLFENMEIDASPHETFLDPLNRHCEKFESEKLQFR